MSLADDEALPSLASRQRTERVEHVAPIEHPATAQSIILTLAFQGAAERS